MIFGRKKRQAETVSSEAGVESQPTETAANEALVVDESSLSESTAETTDETTDESTDETGMVDEVVETDDIPETSAEDSTGDDTGDDTEDGEVEQTDAAAEDELDVEFLDAQEWREDGPWDDSEIDLEEFLATTDVPRIDLGSLILTGTEGMDVQLQVSEETQQIVSAMMLLGEQVEVDGEIHELGSALEVAAFAAPRSGGFWAEVREELIEGAEQAGGNAGLVEGPFGVEVRRLLLVDTPEGEQGYQPSRMWVAEGPRWILRGIVYGHAALEGVPGGHAERVVDLFRQIVVRRGDEPMAPGDLLALTLPENIVNADEDSEESGAQPTDRLPGNE